MSKTHIVLVNYGNWPDTADCLTSLERLKGDFEIILVEVADRNHSRFNLSEFLKKSPLSVELLYLSENKGFAYANNQAMRFIQSRPDAEYIWLLNNDTLVKPDSLSELIKFRKQRKQNENIAFIGSKILYADRPDIIQSVGGSFNPRTGYSVLLGKGENANKFTEQALETDYVIGASMFFNKQLLDSIGFMPDDYFLYYEDIDWCLSAKEAGYKNYTCLTSEVLHKQGGSTKNKYGKTKSENLNTRKYMYSSYLKLYKKKYPERISRARLILLKQFFGRLRRFNWNEAEIILKVLLKK
jgi:GT2 family glycosyltransferase